MTAYIKIVLFLLLLHAALLAYSAYVHTPVVNEASYLATGLNHIYLGQFDLYRVNPPLVRIVAAIPVSLLSPKVNWEDCDDNPLKRSEFAAGTDFLKNNGKNTFWQVTVARWCVIPFSLLGGFICYCWAKKLYGNLSGLVALILWCFCPYVLGHAAIILPDAHAAAMGVAAAYTFWIWLKKPDWWRAVLAGIILGLAELCKFTLLVFYPVWIILWICHLFSKWRQLNRNQWFREVGMMFLLMFLSVFIINFGYGFEKSFQCLGDYRFQSTILTGQPLEYNTLTPTGGNRFTETCLAYLPIPFPKNYLQGIDTQKVDFEYGKISYLCGEWKMGGWWYYYLYALMIKLPIGIWVMFVLAIGVSIFSKNYSSTWYDELFLALPAITILVLASSQSGFSHHTRYVIPMLPFVFIWISKIGHCIELQHRSLTAIVSVILCWSAADSLYYYPHSLSYFNELVGGPINGGNHLLESNLDWGQDLQYLKKWLDENPNVKLDKLAYCGSYPASFAGISASPCPTADANSNSSNSNQSGARFCPKPGWYALSVNYLYDYPGQYAYFLHFKPVAMAGYSIYIYHITLDEANRVRSELGLPMLTEADSKF